MTTHKRKRIASYKGKLYQKLRNLEFDEHYITKHLTIWLWPANKEMFCHSHGATGIFIRDKTCSLHGRFSFKDAYYNIESMINVSKVLLS